MTREATTILDSRPPGGLFVLPKSAAISMPMNTTTSRPPRPAPARRRGGEPESLEVRQVNALLLTRGWAPRDVDHLCGWADGTFSAERSRNFSGGDGVRARVERAFFTRIWSDERTWLLREACVRRYAFDPALQERAVLRAWIKQLGLEHRTNGSATRDQMASVLLNHMATKAA